MSPLLDVRALKVSIRTDEGLAQVLDDVSLTCRRAASWAWSANRAAASPR